jgi:hypothetical protein
MKGVVIGIGVLAMFAGCGWLILWSTEQGIRGSDGERITLAIVAGLLGLVGVAIVWLASIVL